MRADVLAGEECLHAIVQVFIERDLRDGRVDRNLQLRPVELFQRLLDDPIAFLIGVDQQRVVDRVGGDAHARQNAATTTAATTTTTTAEPGARARADAGATERPAAACDDVVRAAGRRRNGRAGGAAAQPRVRGGTARLCTRAADTQAALLGHVTGRRRDAC